MKSITSKWFIAKVSYEKTTDDGTEKVVTEQYVINAEMFGEAESRILEELAQYVSTELNVCGLAIAPFSEVFFSEDNVADNWYKTKIQIITIDERTEREKKTPVFYLVQATCLEDARKSIDDVLKTMMFDYSIAEIKETKIIDVFTWK